MHQLLTSPVSKLLPPLLLLAASLCALFTTARVPPAWQAMLVQALPIAAMGMALMLSIRFNRSNYTFLLILLAVAGLSQTLWRGQILPASENLLFMLLIVNAFAFSIAENRKEDSGMGAVRGQTDRRNSDIGEPGIVDIEPQQIGQNGAQLTLETLISIE